MPLVSTESGLVTQEKTVPSHGFGKPRKKRRKQVKYNGGVGTCGGNAPEDMPITPPIIPTNLPPPVISIGESPWVPKPISDIRRVAGNIRAAHDIYRDETGVSDCFGCSEIVTSHVNTSRVQNTPSKAFFVNLKNLIKDLIGVVSIAAMVRHIRELYLSNRAAGVISDIEGKDWTESRIWNHLRYHMMDVRIHAMFCIEENMIYSTFLGSSMIRENAGEGEKPGIVVDGNTLRAKTMVDKDTRAWMMIKPSDSWLHNDELAD